MRAMIPLCAAVLILGAGCSKHEEATPPAGTGMSDAPVSTTPEAAPPPADAAPPTGETVPPAETPPPAP